ncbi:DUF4880 domain-containing protein [Marinihelvus fidelis]|uniref:DUF4880 domain-containing protein n=1 Tax=Marinihelvus fidelis TaxID=2613842 RepID=A0A5N0T8M2_9GAMM|nr:FecR domain-containing protein [Marinihelvus fidelis]KAA9130176.1 DUF4880 domain-containing protein [Marinihelvus fidelis]
MSDQRAHEEASEWIVRLDADNVTAAERSAFVRWLNRSAENADAYQAMSTLWARMDALNLGRPDAFGEAMPARQERPRGETPWYLGYRVAVAASLAVISLVLVAVMVGPATMGTAQPMHFVTPLNSGHYFEAVDGSSVTIEPGTTATLRYTAGRRVLDLAQGTVWVDVVHDPQRPYTVRVGEQTVTALGTRFSVSADATGTRVRVAEGRVRFTARSGQGGRRGANLDEAGAESIELVAGQYLGYHDGVATVSFDHQRDEEAREFE